MAALIWGVSLAQSIERPSVGNALEQRQLELEVLASRPGGEFSAAEEKLLRTLQQSPEAGSSDSLISQALLEQSLGREEAHTQNRRKAKEKQSQSIGKALGKHRDRTA